MTEEIYKDKGQELRLKSRQFAERIRKEYLKTKEADEQSRMRDMRSYFRRAWELSKGEFFLFIKAFSDFEYETLRDMYHYDSKMCDVYDEFGFGGYRFANLNEDSHTELRQISDMREGDLYERGCNGELLRVTDLDHMLPMELLKLCDEMKSWKDVKPNHR